MHWCHSILTEPTFIAPWQAIENASDLATEVGTSSLPKRRHFAERIVRFKDQVQVIDAEDQEKEFHTFHAHDLQGPTAPPTWSLPRELTIGDTGSSGSRDQRPPDDTGGGDPLFHFLDRRLPDSIPNYIHHLQHLWRE